MPDYEDILNRSWDDIPEPKVVPVGTWRLKGENATWINAKAADQNDRILFVYSLMEPLSDVDEDDLTALGDYDYTQNRVFAAFFMETAKDYDAVRKHMRKHGIDCTGRSMKDTLGAIKGTEVLAYLDTKTFTNSVGDVENDNDPKQFAPVDD
jgi:hypothetical protein